MLRQQKVQTEPFFAVFDKTTNKRLSKVYNDLNSANRERDRQNAYIEKYSVREPNNPRRIRSVLARRLNVAELASLRMER